MNIINQIKHWWWSIDKWILFSTFVLIFIGLLMMMSLEENNFLKKHLIFLPLGIAVILSSSMLKLRHLIILSLILFALFLILSTFPFFFSNEIKGANRWIKFFQFSIQPTEFLKPTFIIVSSLLFSRFQKKKDYSFNINLFVISILATILLLQPDLGMFILFFLTWFTQILLIGLSLKIIFLIILLGLLVLIFSYLNLEHVKFRIDSFYDPNIGDNYQINKSLESFASGGFFGKGLGSGTISSKLPDVHSDFIFALLGEELGFFFLILVLSLYIFIFYRVLVSILKENNFFIFLSSAGLSLILIYQFLINIMSTLNLVPTKGMTLPFLSYGGSSFISCSLIVGFILCLTKKRTEI